MPAAAVALQTDLPTAADLLREAHAKLAALDETLADLRFHRYRDAPEEEP
jgi:hypothetical protein